MLQPVRSSEYFALENVVVVRDIQSGDISTFSYPNARTAETFVAILEAENA